MLHILNWIPYKTNYSMKQLFSIIAFILLVTVIGCKEDETGSTTSGFDRSLMLENLADHVIIPAYDKLNNEVIELDAAVSDFVSTPDVAHLREARDKYTTAYHTWQRASFFEFGPAFDLLLNSSVNSFPADFVNIDLNLQQGDLPSNTTSGQDEKGFPALDFLLFGIAGSEEEIVGLYTNDPLSQNRSAYLKAVVEDIKYRTGSVAAGWAPSGENYRAAFIKQDGTDVGSSIGLMVNELNQFFERETRDKKIGIPLGKRSQGIPIPMQVEAGYSDLSLSLAQENLDAIFDFYMGRGQAEAISFYDYLVALDAQYGNMLLADAIKAQFENALQEVGEIPGPYDETVEANPAPAEEAYAELQKLVILLKADLPSALGVLITYQDNDGD